MLRFASAESFFCAQGNKGATAIRLTFIPSLRPDSDTVDASSPTDLETSEHGAEDSASDAGSLTLTFVNAHLAAFDEMVDRRNQEFHELSKKLMFGRELNETETIDYDDDFGFQPTLPTSVNIYESDALFWMVSFAVALSDILH